MLDYKMIINKSCGLHLSSREIAEQLQCSKSGVNDFLKAFRECDALNYPLPEGITNYAIAEIVYGTPPRHPSRDSGKMMPDYKDVHRQLTNRSNMKLVYLWNRYRKQCENDGQVAYSYRQFCDLYSDWCEENEEDAHFTHAIGQNMEVDLAGQTFQLIDPQDKSSVECAVGILEKGFFHNLEDRQYFDLKASTGISGKGLINSMLILSKRRRIPGITIGTKRKKRCSHCLRCLTSTMRGGKRWYPVIIPRALRQCLLQRK